MVRVTGYEGEWDGDTGKREGVYVAERQETKDCLCIKERQIRHLSTSWFIKERGDT